MIKNILFTALLFTVFVSTGQLNYKQLIQDPTVNFYEVCAAAEAYFQTIDKEAKGSGWKNYERWKYANESKYYPSGDRSLEDPFFVRKAYEAFLKENPSDDTKVLFEAGWEEVGPHTVDSITGHYSAGLGRLESFYVNPTDANTMYIGTRSGGFWKSNDAGLTWSGGSTDFLFASGVNSITASPTNQDSVLINLRNSANGTTHGIYRSIDGGETWIETAFNPIELSKGGLGSNFSINRVAYHPNVPNLIYVCASDGLYRSDDNLTTWLKVTTGSISDIEFHPTNDDIIYIYDYYYWGPNKNKVLRSTDGGFSFVASADIVGNADNTSVQLDVSPLCAECVYFASGNGIWKSFDEGLTFNFVSNPESGSQGFAVGDLDSSKMIYGYVDCYTSADGGSSFEQTTWWSLYDGSHGAGSLQGRHENSAHYIHADLREAECINGVFYVATDGYFGKSEDNGLTWEHLNHTMSIRENYTLGTSQSNHYRTIVGSQDNGTSIKHETTWLEYTGGDGMEGIIHPLNSNWMISSYQYGSRTKTFNGGLTRAGASPSGHSSAWVAPMAYDPNDHLTIYHFGENVHKTNDFTSNWEVVGSPSFGGQILEAAIAENNSDIIIASRQQFIERSMDGGATWVDIKGSLPNYSITDIAFDPKDDNTIVVTYNRYQNDGAKVFITHDMGTTWTNITSNLNDMPIHGAVIDHTNESNIYLAAEIGVYVKTMAATDWELYNEDLPNCSVLELEVVNGSNTLRAATWGRGVWEFALRGRYAFPAIITTEISDQPTFDLPKENVDQYVTSKMHYEHELSEAYIKWSVDEPTFENTIAMNNVSDTTWVTESPIPNYPEGTKIYFKVFAVGEFDDTTETYKFMYEVRPFDYCGGIGSPGTGGDYIDFVELEDISNSTGQDYYGDFTAQVTTLYLDSTYTIQGNLNYSFAPDIIGAWIDYNYNAVFEAEEFIEMSGFDADHQSFGTFTVPAYATLTDTVRLRIRNSYDAELDPCGMVAGEVEDYSIVFSCANSFAEIDAEACFEYVSPSGLYVWEATGLYMDTLTNTNGCDSIISVNLLINSSTGSLVASACETFVSPSGLYTWTESGSYSDTLTNEAGCDSILSIELSIVTLDLAVSVAEYELTANATGVSYQWLDCNADWAIIEGANEQVFTPIDNGSYAVIIATGECSDTSACYDISSLSISDTEANKIRIYPNPTNGNFYLDLGAAKSNVTIQIHNATGQLVYENKVNDEVVVEINLKVAKGIYLMTLIADDGKEMTKKLIIE